VHDTLPKGIQITRSQCVEGSRNHLLILQIELLEPMEHAGDGCLSPAEQKAHLGAVKVLLGEDGSKVRSRTAGSAAPHLGSSDC
jgi:hypothetical protein